MSIAQLEAREVAMEAPSGLWREAWYRLRRNPGAIVGFSLVLLFVLLAIFAPLIAPYGFDQVSADGARRYGVVCDAAGTVDADATEAVAGAERIDRLGPRDCRRTPTDLAWPPDRCACRTPLPRKRRSPRRGALVSERSPWKVLTCGSACHGGMR